MHSLLQKSKTQLPPPFPFTQKFLLTSVKKDKGKAEKEVLILMVLDS